MTSSKHNRKLVDLNDLVDRKDSSKNIVLVVDDSETIRKAVVRLLMNNEVIKSQYRVQECVDGIETLYILMKDQAAGNKVKLVISDENMEYLSGSQSVAIMRELEFHQKIKKVHFASLTAFSDEQTKESIKKSGADVILQKPFSKSEIGKVLAILDNQHK
eukprot:CAMPEP_0170532136 /NCGR_PEP_ID=MMETSP0209-20121228/68809_1 /TAXON_ID=665100 ORGANISM="Litonotus pictus, Strain P1" /NCGR_SAMPLE_ID=MMETSP0209 /ASSEMBLY_ACC=CAM_ASM_000301 /LENGTH=159 /DNA_ID=CAMNT_0010827817 /DNA_START=932 /DNA_END=1411 /DNA_ORIENTATION=-